MRYDYTKGKEARYILSVNRWNGSDYLYFHEYSEAKRAFEKHKLIVEEYGTSLNIYDLKKDVRKCHYRFD